MLRAAPLYIDRCCATGLPPRASASSLGRSSLGASPVRASPVEASPGSGPRPPDPQQSGRGPGAPPRAREAAGGGTALRDSNRAAPPAFPSPSFPSQASQQQQSGVAPPIPVIQRPQAAPPAASAFADASQPPQQPQSWRQQQPQFEKPLPAAQRQQPQQQDGQGPLRSPDSGAGSALLSALHRGNSGASSSGAKDARAVTAASLVPTAVSAWGGLGEPPQQAAPLPPAAKCAGGRQSGRQRQGRSGALEAVGAALAADVSSCTALLTHCIVCS